MFDSFGLDISDLSIKYIYFKPYLFGLALAAFGEVRVPEGVMKDGDIADREAVVHLLRQVVEDRKLTTRFVNVSLPDSKTFIKLLDVSLSEDGKRDPEHVAEAIRKELVNHIPLPEDQLTIDWHFVKHQKTKKERKSPSPEATACKVLVAASQTKAVRDFTDVLRAAGLIPTALEVEAQSILRATMKQSDFVSQANGATVIVDLGQTQTSVIFVQNGAILFTDSLKLSGQEITRKIAQKLLLSAEQAERAKIVCGLNPRKCKGVVKKYLEEHIEHLAFEIQKSREFYKAHFDSRGTLYRVILVGGGANLKDLDESLLTFLHVKPEYGDVFTNLPARVRNLERIPKHELMSYTTAVGLALRSL